VSGDMGAGAEFCACDAVAATKATAQTSAAVRIGGCIAEILYENKRPPRDAGRP